MVGGWAGHLQWHSVQNRTAQTLVTGIFITWTAVQGVYILLRRQTEHVFVFSITKRNWEMCDEHEPLTSQHYFLAVSLSVSLFDSRSVRIPICDIITPWIDLAHPYHISHITKSHGITKVRIRVFLLTLRHNCQQSLSHSAIYFPSHEEENSFLLSNMFYIDDNVENRF